MHLLNFRCQSLCYVYDYQFQFDCADYVAFAMLAIKALDLKADHTSSSGFGGWSAESCTNVFQTPGSLQSLTSAIAD